ncbi:helix-turn-helix domain-containing protein [Kocuria sp. TGY1127_2]|uniref:helix-turn-helix domain-containing protein n=1 Tax=Kocuria sp. TGY1127_2 TaxID=2711328 RepID=UPI0015BB88BB|nr:helix-turn-helix domain-containing protein [Kocuria sp. TGY1127_2]
MTKNEKILAELELHVEGSVETYVDRVLELQDYRDGLVHVEDIRATARESFAALIDQIFTDAPESAGLLVDTARELVMRRRGQGVHLDPLLTAVRLDFTVLWELLKRLCQPHDTEVLVDLAEPLWRAVEDYANGVYRAYLEQSEREVREESVLRQEYLTQALSRDGGAEAMRQASRMVGFDVGEPLVLCVAVGEVGRELRGVLSTALRSALPVHLVNFEGYAVLIFPARLDDVRDRVSRVPCAVLDNLVGLEGVRSKLRLAQRIAEVVAVDDAGAVTPERAWPRVARHGLESIGLDLAEQIEAGLRRARRGEAARIAMTVRQYLSSGSVAEAAVAIPCHRNTVQNHLNRFRELTGIDPGIPEQAAQLVIAWG